MIIHIGFPKCLSTFLQKEVFSRLDTEESIMSDERFTGFILSDKLFIKSNDIMIRGIAAKYNNPKVIVCTREPDGLFKSLYSQYIKQGGYKSFNYWWHTIDYHSLVCLELLVDNIKRYINDVLHITLEEFLEDKEGTVKKICDFIGCPVPEGIDYNKVYGRRWTGVALELGKIRSYLFHLSRLFIGKVNNL